MSDRVLVIGGSSNLGLAAARRLSESGRAVTIAGRNEARLKEAATSLGGVATAVLDVTDPEVVAGLFSAQPPFAHVVVTAPGRDPRRRVRLRRQPSRLDLATSATRRRLGRPIAVRK